MNQRKKIVNYFIFGLFIILIVGFFTWATIEQANNRLSALAKIQRPGNFTLATPLTRCLNGVSQVILSWTNSVNALNYTLERKSEKQKSWSEIKTNLTLEQTNFTDTNFPALNQTYSYRVVAINKRNYTYSNQVTAYPLNCQTVNQPTPPPSIIATSTIKWGAYVGEATGNIANFETQVGRKLDLVAVFVDLGSDPFPAQYAATVKNQGKTLIIFWEPYNASLDDLIAGKYDVYIKQFATSAKTYAGPVILAPLHEMNGNWDPWDGTVGSNTAVKVIAVWQRLYNLFSDVTNVKFGWAVNNESLPDSRANQLENYYPGDNYVDYVGVDGFNFDDPWQSFSEIFNNALSRLTVYHKPIYIFSFACAQGTNKPAWITDALTVQIPKHPEIIGWVWFNENKEQDWRVWSDPASLQAFKQALP